MNVSNSKIGVYVDNQNIRMNGGYGIKFDVLREFACRDNSEAVHLKAYVSYDVTRAQEDSFYKEKTGNFYSKLRDFGYKVCQKHVKWYVDESGNKFGKANSDLAAVMPAEENNPSKSGIEKCFSAKTFIPVLDNGRQVSNSFGMFSINKKDSTWHPNSVLPIRLFYEDLDGRKFKHNISLLIADDTGFAGSFWEPA